MKYSQGVPFTERFFELALTGTEGCSAGYVGLITTNSFMKREFGSKLIEQVLPRLDLTHVVDTSGAYIPGHGTPTVILFGRHRAPVDATVRVVMGIKGEPSTPDDPAHGLVWSAILGQIDQTGSESDFVSVTDTPRAILTKHPWSIGGGGAAELRESIEELSESKLNASVDSIGFMAITGEDDAFLVPPHTVSRLGVPSRAFVLGDAVRDWTTAQADFVAFPYVKVKQDFLPAPIPHDSWYGRTAWINRSFLRSRIMFGKTAEQHGNRWDQYMQFIKNRVASDYLITFAEVTTHNHFVLDRGGKVFKQTAPVIKLPADSSEDDHLGLLGLLNSSVACFWLQQVCHNKGGPGGGSSKDEKWHDFYAFNSTKVSEFPLCPQRPLDIARQLDTLAQQMANVQPAALFTPEIIAGSARIHCAGCTFDPKNASETGLLPTRSSLDAARSQSASLRRQMIAWQEELDWQCYEFYSLLRTCLKGYSLISSKNPPEIALGERAFEIVMARRMAAGTLQTKWFEWLGIGPITEIPAHWPADYREVVQQRIALIESDRSIGLIESAGCKRRWESTPWHTQEQAALRDALLARLEAPTLWPASADQPPQLTSTARLADAVARDAAFMHLAALYAGHADFDLPQLVADLVAAEAVPALPVQRYTDTGLRKRQQWQATWALQRREDAIDADIDTQESARRQELMHVVNEQAHGAEPDADALARVQKTLNEEFAPLRKASKAAEVGAIPVPPKYQSKDFLKTDVWRLRGGLDVPKERWVSYPGCERGADGSLVIAWAGWNHLQQATALASYYLDMKDSEGWDAARLQPLLASVQELLPWLEQWHNELDADFGERMGDYYRSFVTEEARELGFTLEDLRAWRPVVVAARRGRKAKA